ncbi:hypothetical protein CAPTEDRAFT_194402 [Capitella teleta]|uniref:Methyltransferase FkbM domain-containing protein n=1 Tax=Capitella teleta TaxID=283909 RepID=R7UZD3_CAPTE|nr:hypothetical protein CAPTEDRAFT_194402 [Capitella teleta]|eukprot:ELU08786.1 hypothetical protein CAPTEDRAFT_194402 [Capitella teleta]
MIGASIYKIHICPSIDMEESEQQRLRSERVECFPLPSILSAVDIQHVDYFSLDVAGMELDVIKTFPFGAVTSDVITVTFQPHYMSKANSKQYLAEIKLFMEGVGLHDCLGELKAQTGGGRQEGMVVTFVRKGLFKE